MCDMKYVKRIKVWDKEIVFDPNINIIIGPNGSGKTRLLSLLARGLRPRVFPGGDGGVPAFRWRGDRKTEYQQWIHGDSA